MCIHFVLVCQKKEFSVYLVWFRWFTILCSVWNKKYYFVFAFFSILVSFELMGIRRHREGNGWALSAASHLLNFFLLVSAFSTEFMYGNPKAERDGVWNPHK